MNKLCTYCNIEKLSSEFGIQNRKDRKGNIKQYFNIYCKQCHSLKMKKWRLNNPEKVKQDNSGKKAQIRKKRWLNGNLDKRKEYEKQYYIDNIDKFKNTKRIYKNNKRKNDPIFRVRGNVSNAILKALKMGKSNKAGQSILQYLSYNIEDLKKHLEKQFNSDMNWDNYGKFWHIDHIIPQSDLPYSSMQDDNFKICWSLDNLRPLEALQNIKDGASRVRHKKVK